MLDPKRLRAELELVAEQLARRGYQLDIEKMKSLEEQRKALQIEQQELQNERNTKSKSIGKAKAAGEDVQPLLDEVAGLGDKLKAVSEKSDAVQAELHALMMSMPNTPHDSVPDGKDEEDNREERTWGEIPTFDFEPKDHVDLGEGVKQLDFDTAAKVTGSRFVSMSGGLARLHRALTQFMLDTHIAEHGYTEVYVPYIVNGDSLYGTGQLPKFEEDLFKLEGTDYYLIPTAEVPVT
jgi:seryl-tRNA synthetase